MNILTATVWLLAGFFLGHALLAGDRGEFGNALGLLVASTVVFTIAIVESNDS